MEELTQASHKMAEQMYKSAEGENPSAGAPGGDGPMPNPGAGPAPDGDGKVVDAEFEETN